MLCDSWGWIFICRVLNQYARCIYEFFLYSFTNQRSNSNGRCSCSNSSSPYLWNPVWMIITHILTFNLKLHPANVQYCSVIKTYSTTHSDKLNLCVPVLYRFVFNTIYSDANQPTNQSTLSSSHCVLHRTTIDDTTVRCLSVPVYVLYTIWVSNEAWHIFI